MLKSIKKELSMQKLFDEVGSLDAYCYEKYNLSEDILIEHAAEGMSSFIRSKFPYGSSILIVCGNGNNGADGMALARLLHKDYDVTIFTVREPKKEMVILQDKRSHAISVRRTLYLNDCDVIVDAIFGTGFDGSLDAEDKSVLQTINSLSAYKIACDIPSGMRITGECDKDTFIADTTLTMGALKKLLYNDQSKAFVGNIEVLSLGVAREIYESDTNWYLLGFQDMKLPRRTVQNTHKGSFGHLCVGSGKKMGASIISSLAALNFGAGLVTLLSDKKELASKIPYELMLSKILPNNTTALAFGMGLGSLYNLKQLKTYLANKLPLIVDADLFYMPIITEILKRQKLVLTPHPKEFVSLLKLTSLADIDVKELQNKRFEYCELFSKNFPDVVLLLKGANVIIAHKEIYYINPHGTPALAKGGSGDVLSGLIGALLAQGYEPLDATITASLTHAKLAQNYTLSDFSLTPEDLIRGIANL